MEANKPKCRFCNREIVLGEICRCDKYGGAELLWDKDLRRKMSKIVKYENK